MFGDGSAGLSTLNLWLQKIRLFDLCCCLAFLEETGVDTENI